MTDWGQRVQEWLKGPCPTCPDSSSLAPEQHVGMGVTRPHYVDPTLEQIAGPDEQHRADPNSHCVNVKCNQQFDDSMVGPDGSVTCPNPGCGWEQNVMADPEATWKPGESGRPELNPGGITRSGLTLERMGTLGEEIVKRMGDLPGIGSITPASDQYNHPIDVIVESQRGKFGCEIKTQHSQAQERFKIGGKAERQEKIAYCLTHGLKPALIGVRLNFYTDKAYVFFREGLTDTWIGNAKMLHVATLDFSDLNPFKSPDPQAQALAVDNAHLQDQADEEEEFDRMFGQMTSAEQPREDDGTFTFKSDAHEVKVKDKTGKHVHSLKRCHHCGSIYGKPAEHTGGRIECPSCGQDPERKLHEAKVVLAGPSADDYARKLGFAFLGRNGQGHRKYAWTDPAGVHHGVLVGQGGSHGRSKEEIDASFARQRMTKCLSGKCMHVSAPPEIALEDDPDAPVFRKGATIRTTTDDFGTVLDIDGEAALIQNFQTGQKEWVPAADLQSVA